jgi:DNA-binding FadR family transcriptional regulator
MLGMSRLMVREAVKALQVGLLDDLSVILEAMRASMADQENLTAQDAAFHDRVAAACGNATLATLLTGLSSKTLARGSGEAYKKPAPLSSPSNNTKRSTPRSKPATPRKHGRPAWSTSPPPSDGFALFSTASPDPTA